jgi:uncharacterized protein (TIGR02246 family)
MSSLNDQIASLYDHLSKPWKSHDGAAVARFFTDDGSLVSSFGERADGRTAIAAMYTEYFRGGLLSGTSTAVSPGPVRAVGEGHALADAEQTIRGPEGNVVLVVHLTTLLRREPEGWRIVDGRPHAYAPRT